MKLASIQKAGKKDMRVRNALLPDAAVIYSLIFEYARHGTLLPRSLPEIYENIRDFMVVKSGRRVIGCGALHFYGMHLAELRSIAVWPDCKGRGAGRALIDALLNEAHRHSIACVCLFTRTPEFFSHMGFTEVKRERLPDKLNKDCRNCRNRKCCDEIAMIRGRLPKLVRLKPVPEKAAQRRKGARK
jgi:amino-acid N-acetyltransferase